MEDNNLGFLELQINGLHSTIFVKIHRETNSFYFIQKNAKLGLLPLKGMNAITKKGFKDNLMKLAKQRDYRNFGIVVIKKVDHINNKTKVERIYE